MMQVFQAIFLACACLNSTLPSSTYPVMFHCLPLSSIFYNIWFPLPHSFSPLSILSQQFPDTIARHCCHHHHAYVESIWCDYGMVEAESPFKLLPHPYYTHLQSVWAHWYAVHQHMVGAFHSYTHPTLLRFWGSVSLLESTWWWCHYVMVKADSHLKPLPPSILDIYKVFEHIDMLSNGVQ